MLLQYGIDRYLMDLEEAQRRHAAPLFVPGVEVTPFYHWTGSLLTSDLALNNTQRDLLVIAPVAEPGGESPASGLADFLSHLPVIENPAAERYGWSSLAELLPGFFLIAWGLLRFRRPADRALSGPTSPGAARRARNAPALSWSGGHRAVGSLVLIGIGVALLSHHYPFTQPLLRPYDGGDGYVPEQALIDYVSVRDGATFWSTPEVTDEQEIGFGPFRIRLETLAYTDGLEETVGYTGFGSLYADRLSAIDPGGLWDRLLLAHTEGASNSPAWVVGETAFRYTGQAGKFLSEVVTVLLVDEVSHKAAFEALRTGRSYALRQTRDVGLRLREFTLAPAASTTTSAAPTIDEGERATAGGELRLTAGSGLALWVDIVATGSQSVPCEILVIRGGNVAHSWEGVTPVRQQIIETIPDDVDKTYYRIEVRGPRPHRLVSNPIFVSRQR